MDKYVTICVPIYNVEKYIERCSRSLFEQTYPYIEYLFVDDCTPDNSIGVLQKIIEEYPIRKAHVRIIHHPVNKGLSGARNTVVDNCLTEFIMHVDSDDWIDLNVVEKCIKVQEKTNADIVSFGVKRFVNGQPRIDKIEWLDDAREMTRRIIIHKVHNGIWGRLIKTSLYKDHDIKVEFGRGQAEDLQVIPRLFYYSKNIAFIGEVYYNYFVGNPSSYTSSFSVEKVADSRKTFELLEKFFLKKDEVLLQATKKRKVKALAKGIINCVKAKADRKDYIWMKSLQDDDVRKFESFLSWPERIVFHLNNWHLMRAYVYIASRINSVIKVLKY